MTVFVLVVFGLFSSLCSWNIICCVDIEADGNIFSADNWDARM